MEQRFLRTNDPNLHKGEAFKHVVVSALASALLNSGYSTTTRQHIGHCIDEVANMTAQVPAESLGQAVQEYLGYRFAGEAEPEWHRSWCDQQDREDASQV